VTASAIDPSRIQIVERRRAKKGWVDFIQHVSLNTGACAALWHMYEAVEQALEGDELDLAEALMDLVEQYIKDFDENVVEDQICRWVEYQQPAMWRKLKRLRGEVVDPAWWLRVAITDDKLYSDRKTAKEIANALGDLGIKAKVELDK
jgi:hypothetical protein